MFQNKIKECKELIEAYRKQGLMKSGIGKPFSIKAAEQFLEKLEKASKNKLTRLSSVFNVCDDYYRAAKSSIDKDDQEEFEKHKNVLDNEVKKNRALRRQLYLDLMNKILTEETFRSLAEFRTEDRTEADRLKIQNILSVFFSPFKRLDASLPNETAKEEVFQFFLNAPGQDKATFQQALEKLEGLVLSIATQPAPASEKFALIGSEAVSAPYLPSAPETEEQFPFFYSEYSEPPPAYTPNPQAISQAVSYTPLVSTVARKTEHSVEGGPCAPSPFQDLAPHNLATQLAFFQESNKKDRISIDQLERCRRIAEELASKYQSNDMENKTGGIRIRHFNKEAAEGLDKGTYKIKQPWDGGMQQFQGNALPVLMQGISSDDSKIADPWKDFMQSRVYCGYDQEKKTKTDELTLSSWICRILARRRMQVNEDALLSRIKNNSLQAVAFLPPVVFNTEGEKALITCQGLNNGRDADRYLTAVLKHQENEKGESFYSLVGKVNILKHAYEHECIATEGLCITVNPVPNELLQSLLDQKEDSVEIRNELRNLANQHYLVITMELEKNVINRQCLGITGDSDDNLLDDDDLQPDGVSEDRLVARGGGSAISNIISDMDDQRASTAKLKTCTDDLTGTYTILTVNMTILKCETLKISKDNEHLDKDTLEQFMQFSMKRLESAVGLHERKKPLTRFGKFVQEKLATEETPRYNRQPAFTLR